MDQLKETANSDHHFPFVSIILPVFNDPEGLADTLNSLLQQDYQPGRWEIIVVDNNSTDNTPVVAQSYDKNYDNIHYLIEKNVQSSYAARNRGIEQSSGTLLAFIDSDMTVERGWLQRGVTHIVEGHGHYIGCPVEIYPKNGSPNIVELFNIRTGFPIQKYINKFGFAGAGNIFINREIIDTVGSFDERLISGGDKEFGNRVKDYGFIQFYDKENIMKHPARVSMRSLCKKTFRKGKGFVELQNYYPDRYGKIEFSRVIITFIPAIRVGIRTHFADLPLLHKMGIFIIANIVRLSAASGRLYRYLQIKVT